MPQHGVDTLNGILSGKSSVASGRVLTAQGPANAALFESPSGSGLGGILPGYVSATVPSGSTDNFNPGGGFPGTASAPICRVDLNASAAATLLGLIAGFDGQEVQLYGIGAGTVTLDVAASSTAANDFQGTGNTAIAPNGSLRLVYYSSAIVSTAAGWRICL